MNYNRNMILNFKNTNYFRSRYNRDPKNWTLESLYELYLKAFERNEIRQKYRSSITDRVINEIEEFESGKRKIYYRTDDGDIIQYTLEYRKEFKGWAIGHDYLKFDNKNKEQNRNEKLEFILSKEKEFELGKLYYESDRLSYMHYQIWEIISLEVCEKLRERFKDVVTVPNIFTVKVGPAEFYVTCTQNHSVYYKDFKLMNKVCKTYEI